MKLNQQYVDKDFETFVGTATSLHPLLKQLPQIVYSNNTILITGESGTGKTRLANYIHQQSKRSKAPFVSISCAAIPTELLESEFFGHEKGAFSGASQSQKGKAEIANGGTLFLDEIGEMPIALQAKLLNFLQEKAFYRVGGTTRISTDIRIIAATNRNLKQSIKERTFREDLYFRLNVLPLEMPPLRERKADIPILALDMIKKQFHDAERRMDFQFKPKALDAVLNYAWPGNIRELENAMARAATLVDEDGLISAEHLPSDLFDRDTGHSDQQAANLAFTPKTLAQIEKESIQATLAYCKGNKAQAARILAISEKSIYNKINRFKI